MEKKYLLKVLLQLSLRSAFLTSINKTNSYWSISVLQDNDNTDNDNEKYVRVLLITSEFL